MSGWSKRRLAELTPSRSDFETSDEIAKVFRLAERAPGHVHPACKAAWDTGEGEACEHCTYRLCPDFDCEIHEICRRENGWVG